MGSSWHVFFWYSDWNSETFFDGNYKITPKKLSHLVQFCQLMLWISDEKTKKNYYYYYHQVGDGNDDVEQKKYETSFGNEGFNFPLSS